MKKENAIIAYRLLSAAKLGKMPAQDKFKAVRNVAALRKLQAELDEIVKQAKEQLAPEGWEQAQERAKDWQALSEAERQELNAITAEYNKAVSDCAAKWLADECDAPVERIGEEALGELLDANPEWRAGEISALFDAIGA